MSRSPRVLFVCVENACRSQIAEGFARKYGADRVEAFSAGSRPAVAINPRAVALMAECGCDISTQVPKPLRAFEGQAMDVVVTMGCGDVCPWLPAHERIDWDLPDPKRLSDDAFRRVRDDIGQRVRGLLDAIEDQPDSPR